MTELIQGLSVVALIAVMTIAVGLANNYYNNRKE